MSKKWYWAVENGKRTLVLEPIAGVEPDIPWGEVKKAINLLLGYGFETATLDDFQDIIQAYDLTGDWPEIKKALIKAGAISAGPQGLELALLVIYKIGGG